MLGRYIILEHHGAVYCGFIPLLYILLPDSQRLCQRTCPTKMVVLATAFVAFLAVASTAGARMMRKDEMRAHQEEAAKRWQHAGPAVSRSTNVKRSDVQNITFTNPKASGKCMIVLGHQSRLTLFVILSEFWVNGSALPLVDFDVGPSWAGLLPISNNPNETRQVRRQVEPT